MPEEAKVYDKVCRTCGEKFKSKRKNVVFCGFGCTKKEIEDAKIRSANERWLKKPAKPNGWR